jgi:hypothetical protein
MAEPEYIKQYRTVHTAQTSADDGLNVAAIRFMSWGMNNAKMMVAPRIWDVCIPYMETIDASTAENVLKVYGPVFVPHGFDKWTYTIGHICDGTELHTLRLYSCSQLYTGPIILDTDYLGQDYDGDTTGVEVGTGGASTHTVTCRRQELDIIRDDSGYSWLVLTGENEAVAPAAVGKISTLDITAQISAAY